MSPLSTILFDLDGTLVDSNGLHVRAWMAALADCSYRVSQDRLEKEIGKGGDQLVESLLGKEAESKDGDALRNAQAEHAMMLIRTKGVNSFNRAVQLINACRGRGLKVALVTSSSKKLQSALLHVGGITEELFDLLVSGDDVKATKPQADLYHVAIEKLGLSPAECVNVGDTPYDCIAARKAGLVTIGLSGDLNDAETLRKSGARWTVHNAAELEQRLDEALKIAAPGSVRLTRAEIDRLMNEALAVAEQGMAAGEVPIGAVVANGEGTIIGRGYNRLNATKDRIAHAEVVAFHDAAGKADLNARDLIIVSTLEPCVMCLGAAMEAGIDTVLYGLRAPADGGAERITPPVSPESQMPRIIGQIMPDRVRAQFVHWLKGHPESEQAKFVKQLLEATK